MYLLLDECQPRLYDRMGGGGGVLGGELYYYRQEAALRAANEYVQRAPGTCTCGFVYALECS